MARLNETAWRAWFDDQGVTPYENTYEDLAADPVGVTEAVLQVLGPALPANKIITVLDGRRTQR